MIKSDSLNITNDRVRSNQARVAGHVRKLSSYKSEKCDYNRLLPYQPIVLPDSFHSKLALWALKHRKISFSVKISSKSNPFIYNSVPTAAIKRTASLELDSSFEDFEEYFFATQRRFMKLSVNLQRAVLSNSVLNIYPRALFYISASSERFRIGEEYSQMWINGKKKRSPATDTSSELFSALKLLLQQEELFPVSLAKLSPYVFQILHDVKSLNLNLPGEDFDCIDLDFDSVLSNSVIPCKDLWRIVANFTNIEELSLVVWKDTGCFQGDCIELLYESLSKLTMLKKLGIRFRPQSTDYSDLLSNLKKSKHIGRFTIRIDIQTHDPQIFQEIGILIPRPSTEGVIMRYKRSHTLDFTRNETIILKEEHGSFAVAEICTQANEILLASKDISALASSTKELYISNVQLEGFRSTELRKFNGEFAKASKFYSKLSKLIMNIIIYPETEQDILNSLLAPLGNMPNLTDLRLEMVLVSETLNSQDHSLSDDDEYFYHSDDSAKQPPVHYPLESLIEDLDQISRLESPINFELVLDTEALDTRHFQNILTKVTQAPSIQNFTLKIAVSGNEMEIIPSKVSEAIDTVKFFRIKEIKFEHMDAKTRLGFVPNYHRGNFWTVVMLVCDKPTSILQKSN